MSKAAPRRVLRNAKGASKELEGKGDIESGDAFDRIRGTSFTARFAAWGIIVGTIFTLIIGGRCILQFSDEDDRVSSLPAPVESPAPTPTEGPLVGPGPFPDAPTTLPIITGADCPDGAVKIATGPGRAVDTVCIRGRVVDTYSEASSVTVTPTPGLSWGMVCTGPGQCVGPIFRPCVGDELKAITGECVHIGDAGEGGR